MERRSVLHGCLLGVLGTAGCMEQSGDAPATSIPTTSGTQTATKNEVPGWNGTSLDVQTLLQTHTNTLTTAESYTAAITTTGTQQGEVTLQFRLNATQQRIHGTSTVSQQPDRAVYLTPERSVTRITGAETRYSTGSGQPISDVFKSVATYQNNEYNLNLADTVRAFEYTYDSTTTANGVRVFRFTSTRTSLSGDAEAVLAVDAEGVLRSVTVTRGETTITYEFTAINETAVSPPAWLESVSQQTTTQEPEPTVQDGDLVIDVTALQWYWEFTYDNRGLTTTDELVVPVGQPVALRVTTSDVPHAITIAAFNTTVEAKPDQTNIGRFTPSDPGEYLIACSEYCGTGHSEHTATLTVVDADEYETWLQNH